MTRAVRLMPPVADAAELEPAPTAVDGSCPRCGSGAVSSAGSTPTLAEVRTWPATVSVPVAAAALGCSRSQLYELIKAGRPPVKVLSFGQRHVVITADLVRVLSGERGEGVGQ